LTPANESVSAGISDVPANYLLSAVINPTIPDHQLWT